MCRSQTVSMIQFHHGEYLRHIRILETLDREPEPYLMLVPPQGQILKALRVLDGPTSTRELNRFTGLEPSVINSALYALDA